MKAPVITLLTDFGLCDHYVAAMKGVILSICPEARLVDISHNVTPFAIPEAAYTLAQAWDNFPEGTVHLAVVDPGVGSTRRPIVAEAGAHRFVTPDNGLLGLILPAQPRAKVRAITADRYFRQPVSATFHGRDIFAPVAAHLARGVLVSKLGKLISDPDRGNFAKPVKSGPATWQGTVLKIDSFGNIITNFDWYSFSKIGVSPFSMRISREIIKHFYPTYSTAPKGTPFAIRGSSGYVEVSLNQSDAAARLDARPGAAIALCLKTPLNKTTR